MSLSPSRLKTGAYPPGGLARSAGGTLSEAVERYVADYRARAASLPGARLPWLAAAREAAIEGFARQGFPTLHDEAWKYTALGPIEKKAFPLAQADLGKVSQVGAWLLEDVPHRLVFVDGRYAPALSHVGALPAPSLVDSLAEVLARAPHLAEPYLSEAPAAGAFVALNSAFMADGAFVQVGEGVALEEPIHLLFVSTATGSVSHPRNLIVAAEGAAVTVVEHYVALDEGGYFTNAVTQIAAGRGARVEHYKVQQESVKAFHIATVAARQEADSRFDSHSLSLGADLARHDIATRFDGTGCETTLNGLYVVAGRQHVDHHTTIDHAQPQGTSREFYRGILDDRARAVFTGRIVVHKDAQKTDAGQINHNLLLSRDAEVDTRPQLEIYADDVKCSHGATVGQLDDNMLFYLRTRGLEEGHARDLLTYAFAAEVLERIRIRSLRERTERLMVERMADAERLRELV